MLRTRPAMEIAASSSTCRLRSGPRQAAIAVVGKTSEPCPVHFTALSDRLGGVRTGPQQQRFTGCRQKDASGRLHGNFARGRLVLRRLIHAANACVIALQQRARAAQCHPRKVQQQRLIKAREMIQLQGRPAAKEQRIGHFHVNCSRRAAIDGRRHAGEDAVA